MQQTHQQFPPLQSICCKNHPQVASRYFVTEQPWIKYCKECALNVALCGRNISQDFSTDQFERKMQITSIANQLRRNAEQIKENNSVYEKINKMLEDSAKPLNEHISDIDRAIKELTSAKEKLQRIYDDQVMGRVNEFLERQSRMALTCRETKLQLQSIQSNFSSFIEMESEESFEEKLSEWSQLIKTSKKQIISQDEFSNTKNRLFEVMDRFYGELEQLSSFSLNLPINSSQFFRPIEDTFSMVLTPVDSNSLNASLCLESNPFKKTKRQLKLRTNRKNYTDRDIMTSKQSKRASLSNVQNINSLSEIYRTIK